MLPNAITYLSFNLMAFFLVLHPPTMFFLWQGFILRNLPKLKITLALLGMRRFLRLLSFFFLKCLYTEKSKKKR